jgi:hypothetical protein
MENNSVTITKKKCNECGEVKSDVQFRTWGGIDAAEWDIICASCLEKKKREMTCFWILFGSITVIGLFTLLMFGALLVFT